MAKYFLWLALAAVLAVATEQREDRPEIARGAFDLARRTNAARTPENGAPMYAGHRRPPITYGGRRRGHGHGHGHGRGGHHRRGGPGSQTGRSGLHSMHQMHRAVMPAFSFKLPTRNGADRNPGSHHQRMMEAIRTHLGTMRTNGFPGHSTRGQGRDPQSVLSQNLRFATQLGRRGHHGNRMQHGHTEGSDDMRPEMRVAHHMGHHGHMGHGHGRMGHHRGHGMGPRYTVA